ncbi:hypothetical protein VTN77DRAFT_5434 [Rasamsonia byssochlamydoides]|uniref:uncharacterized protein n=1 Tax=Rasamsonia byssochlamydoides TaxID=89139 RepID=UPI003742731E
MFTNKAIVIVDQCEDPSTKVQKHHYRISGINAIHSRWDQTLRVPGDRRQVSHSGHNAGYPGKTTNETVTIYRATHWGSLHDDVYPHRYTIHAQCWELIEHSLYSGKIEDHLDTLITTLRKRWKEQPFGLKDYYSIRDPEKPWIPNSLWPDGGSRSAAYKRFVADPINISELEDLIVKSSRRRQRRRRKSQRYNNNNDKAIIPDFRQHQHLSTSDLPQDIQFHILDQMCSPEVENTIQGLGWSIPDYYWQVRTPLFIFEVKKSSSCPTPAPFDWQSFALGVEDLLRTSLGLQNRRRIFRILQRTKACFHMALRVKMGNANCKGDVE